MKEMDRAKIFFSKFALLLFYFAIFLYLHAYFYMEYREFFLSWLLRSLLSFLVWLSQKEHFLYFLRNIFPALLFLLGTLLFFLYGIYTSIGRFFFRPIYIVSADRKTKIGTALFQVENTIYFYTGLFPNLLVPYSSLQKLRLSGKEKKKEKASSIEIHTNKQLRYIGRKTYIFSEKKEEKKKEKQNIAEIFRKQNAELLHNIQQKVQEASMVDSTVLKKQIQNNTIYIPADILSYMEEEENAGRNRV